MIVNIAFEVLHSSVAVEGAVPVNGAKSSMQGRQDVGASDMSWPEIQTSYGKRCEYVVKCF